MKELKGWKRSLGTFVVGANFGAVLFCLGTIGYAMEAGDEHSYKITAHGVELHKYEKGEKE